MHTKPLLFSTLLTCLAGLADAAEVQKIDYQQHIAPIFTKYCVSCHNEDDLQGGLTLESFAALQEGGDNGVAVLPGQSDSSRLLRVLTGQSKPKMPPEDNKPPSDEEIQLIRQWIELGAPGPDGESPQLQLITPYISTPDDVHQPITAIALSPDGNLLAIARFGRIDVLASVLQQPRFMLDKLPGKVNSLSFSANGKLLVATGIAGLHGEAILYDADSGEELSRFTGHKDTLYDAVLSPDGTRLATCSYDRKIIVWDAATGEQLHTLSGHNGPVFDLDFSPDGNALASASGDETIKLWRVTDGARLDTLGQPEGEQYAVTFSPDGRYVVGGGADNRIRVWRFVSREKPGINPLVFARFAHEGAVTQLAFAADGRALVSAAEDRTLKTWQSKSYAETKLYEMQPDVVTDIAVAPFANAFVVARMDGSRHVYAAPVAATAHKTTAKMTDVDGTDMRNIAVDGDVDMDPIQEVEPNDQVASAMPVSVPAKVTGVIYAEDSSSPDEDIFRFESEAGQQWVFEVNAARQDSLLDSFIEVLDANGNSIERVLLQAVRDSYFTFRGKDSTTNDDFRVQNWEEMTLNQYLYANGEVVKLWLYPRGPDSGFRVYPGEGNRYTYFDTTPLAHALGEPCYIVQPHPPGASLIPNGLPVFPIYYQNDDDSRRAFGVDSRLTFTAPRDGEYLVRIRDTRGFTGEDFKYELTLRPRRPDFGVNLDTAGLTIPPGTGKEFRVSADRYDDYEGPIRVEIAGLPEGFTATSPLIIDEGQVAAFGTVMADADAEAPDTKALEDIRITATAEIGGNEVAKRVGGFDTLKLAEHTKLAVQILPAEGDALHSGNVFHARREGEPPSPRELLDQQQPLELTIAPGETIAARVRLLRRGFEGQVLLGNDDAGRNLPHGVYVDNIGLNGLTILAGQNERVFFITADDWVPEQSRTFHLKARAGENPTSQPVVLRVKRQKTASSDRLPHLK